MQEDVEKGCSELSSSAKEGSAEGRMSYDTVTSRYPQGATGHVSSAQGVIGLSALFFLEKKKKGRISSGLLAVQTYLHTLLLRVEYGLDKG